MNQKTAARRQHISEMIAQGKHVDIPKLAKEFGVHPTTIYRDKQAISATQAPISEMINRGAHPAATNMRWQTVSRTVDYTQVNYEFWGKLRRLKAQGYELGALFAQPMVKTIVATVLGEGVQFTVKSDTPRDPDNPHPIETIVNGEFISTNKKLIGDLYYDELTLGDVYAVVNPDTSITPVQPSQVELDTDPLEWRKINRVVISTKSEKSVITDTYALDQRTIKIKVNAQPAKDNQPAIPASDQTFTFPNLLDGLIPVVHFAYGREANELYGHPYYEGLLTLFAEYDDTIRKSLDGVKAMGHPVPVVEGAEDTKQVIEDNATDISSWRNSDGSEESRKVIEFERLTMLVLGKGASFNFKSPGQFTQDAGRMLEFLFLLMLQHARIPEWVWGGAVNSSMASVSAQTPAWHDVIRGFRADLEIFLLELVTIWLAMKALTDPSLTLAEGETLEVKWPELSGKDEKFEWQKALDTYDRGVLTNETLLTQAEIVADAEKEVEAAEEQAKAEQDEFEARLQQDADAEDERIAQFGRDDNEDERKAA